MRILTIVLVATLVLAVLIIVLRTYFSNTAIPEGVGIGTIADCPPSPNCVSTQAKDGSQKISPISFDGNPEQHLNSIAKIIEMMPKSKIVSRTDNYLHAEFRSSFWNFVDDVEFFVNTENGTIDSRSAARMGYSDMGINKARYQSIVEQLNSP